MKKNWIIIFILGGLLIFWVVKQFVYRAEKGKTALATIQRVPNFKLVNQDGKYITNKDYLGKVYVAEFFFTTCPNICKDMNANMLKLQNHFFGHKNFGILSFSVNPEYDTTEVLKAYANKLGVVSPNWNFLTGDQRYIYNLALKGYFVTAKEDEIAEGGFVHSEYFVLVDKKGNIRSRVENGTPKAVYFGTNPKEIQKLKEDITILLNEE